MTQMEPKARIRLERAQLPAVRASSEYGLVPSNYWNPNVVTDGNGHAEIEFYNNSYSTKFNVSGCGITAGGSPYVLDKNF